MNAQSILELLAERFAAAITHVAGAAVPPEQAHVRPAGDAKHGDYQCNAALPMAKKLGAKPAEIAQRIVDAVSISDICAPPTLAGPGFINLTLCNDFLAARLDAIPPAAGDGRPDRCGIAPASTWRRTIVDYSSPNIAKQMHVGHLRSTIIGDTISRVLEFQGHEVVRQNHVGDWGTQFGMLIAHYAEHPFPTADTPDAVLARIEDDYRAASERYGRDAEFAAAARSAVGRLQSGDAAARDVWQRVCAASHGAFGEIYARLRVRLRDADTRGESYYNSRLAAVVQELREKLPRRDAAPPGADGWVDVRDDGGAVCIFFWKADGTAAFKTQEGAPLPMIIRKEDGAFLYATTDLAALRYRIEELHGRRLVYVTDPRQRLHFEMLFAVARAAGWACHEVTLEHVTFGSVLGKDRKPLKTRTGQNVKLRELLDEAERQAREVLEAKLAAEEPAYRDSFDESERARIARAIGIGAVKYFDMNRELQKDYVFDWDNLKSTVLALQGNTAPYLLYACARVRSIHRRAAEAHGGAAADGPLRLTAPAERSLALRLLRLQEAVNIVAADLTPHVLCTYLYDLSADFMRFYEACPVLTAPDAATRAARLRLCDLTARAIALGLGLLGIDTVERM